LMVSRWYVYVMCSSPSEPCIAIRQNKMNNWCFRVFFVPGVLCSSNARLRPSL
jgi:hypothetical protein